MGSIKINNEVRVIIIFATIQITNTHGPDTGTWSMHTVGWLELGDHVRAYNNFMMMFRNINGPFKVFSEKVVTSTAYGGCVNFITGAGGLLQSVIFGYGGVRLYPDRMDLNPYLLPNTTAWSLTGIHYKHATFDVIVTNNDVTVTLMTKQDDVTISITTEELGTRTLSVNIPLRMSLHRVASSIRVVPVDDIKSPPTTPSSDAPTLHNITCVFYMLMTVILLLL